MAAPPSSIISPDAGCLVRLTPTVHFPSRMKRQRQYLLTDQLSRNLPHLQQPPGDPCLSLYNRFQLRFETFTDSFHLATTNTQLLPVDSIRPHILQI